MNEIEKYHLNWDGSQNNGIILNDEYHWGALFRGEEFKPKLSFEYTDFSWGYALDKQDNYYKDLNGEKHIMTEEQEEELLAIAKNWKQAEGQEGNMPQVAQPKVQNPENREQDIINELYSLSEEDRKVAIQELADKYGVPYDNVLTFYNANKPA